MASLRILTVYPFRFGLHHWSGTAASQALPELAEMLMQFRIFYVTQTFPRDDDDIPANQKILVQAERVAHQAFESVALNGELDALFPDHKPQTRVIELVFARKEQQVFPWNLAGWGVKDRFEVSGCQKTLFPTVVLTHPLCRVIKLPDAHGLWHGDATVRHGRSW